MVKKLSLILLFSLLLASCGSMEPTADPNIIRTLTAQPTNTQFTRSTTPPEPVTAKVSSTPIPRTTSTSKITPTSEFTPTESWTNFKAGNVTAPILLYYNIADSREDDLYYQTDMGKTTMGESKLNIGSRQFEQEMMALSDLGYNSITVAQLTGVIREGGILPPRPVLITFDSDKRGIYNHAYPILKKYGFVGTIYVVVNQLDTEGFITTSQLREMSDSGWDVGSRGMTGQNLVDLYMNNGDLLGYEINSSKTELEKILGNVVTSFSYPDRAVDKKGEITTRVRNWGYKSAVSILNSADHSTRTLYFLSRYEIKNNLSLFIFTSYLPWKVANKRISPNTIAFGTPPPEGTSTFSNPQDIPKPTVTETPTP